MQIIKSKNIKWWVGIGACFILFSIIIVFAYIKMYFLVNGVKIKAWLEYKENTSIVEVKGNAKNAIYLSLNGREIYINKDGSFIELISLLPGFGIITLNAKDKFGKVTEKKIEIFNKEV